MAEKDTPRIETKVPRETERKDANTVIVAVNTATAVVNTGLAIHDARKSGKPKEPPKKDK